jgi:hypothetical protein
MVYTVGVLIEREKERKREIEREKERDREIGER